MPSKCYLPISLRVECWSATFETGTTTNSPSDPNGNEEALSEDLEWMIL